MARRKRITKQNTQASVNFGHANPKQRLFYESDKLFTAFGGARGGGKAEPLSEPVLTPFGFRPMGSLKEGSTVCTPDGGTAKVIRVYPQGKVPIYKLTFIDGATVRCTLDHLWLAKRTNRHSGWKIYDTRMLMDILNDKSEQDSNILVPVSEPVMLTPGRYGGKIKPYTLGVLLGDGGLTQGQMTVTTEDAELIDLVREDGYKLSIHKVDKNNRFNIIEAPEEKAYIKRHKLDCRSEFKYVPNGYKLAPEWVRRAVLQGLMDTDGYADKRGHCEFCSTSKQLAEDVQWLVRSLGGKATIREKETHCYTEGYEKAGQKAFIVYIQTKNNEELFRLTRKRERCKDKPFNGGVSELCRRLISIEPCGEEEAQCILIDDPKHLYITNDFVVTHNTHAVRIKAVGGALRYPGIKILIIRRTYPELQSNHIEPILKLVPSELATYNGTLHTMYFLNGSIIHFGHYQGTQAETEYQGQEYDWIFIDEATQFTEREFRFLGGLLRGVTDIPKRFYLTCNPGGVGHLWVKRLFIDREYRKYPDNPEADEVPEDYCFIQATVEDNPDLLKASPAYLQMLSSLPENIRKAHRYGDWNALSGAYFPEFSLEKHVIKPCDIPAEWLRYRAFDYGLDMLACYWIAVDFNGRCYVYKEYRKSGLIVSEAAQEILDRTLVNEQISITFAPPDIWSTQKDTGKTMAEIFMQCGLPIVRANNSRVQGWLQLKELLKDMPDGRPGLVIFDHCKGIIDDLQAIQADDKNPDDCAKQPHEITHSPDALRYFAQSRTLSPEPPQRDIDVYEEEDTEDYGDYMTGGAADASYLYY